MAKVPKRIASTVINSLKGGVVPRVGLPYVTVGREHEIEALLHDVDIIREGGASFRFIVGKYGSGKSFLLQTIRNYAMDLGFVVMDADLSPERRLQGTHGQGLATYKELVRNMATKTRPEGGALTLILDRWISGVQSQVAAGSGLEPGTLAFEQQVEARIQEVIGQMGETSPVCSRFTTVPTWTATTRPRDAWSSGSAANTPTRPKPDASWASALSSATTTGMNTSNFLPSSLNRRAMRACSCWLTSL